MSRNPPHSHVKPNILQVIRFYRACKLADNSFGTAHCRIRSSTPTYLGTSFSTHVRAIPGAMGSSSNFVKGFLPQTHSKIESFLTYAIH
jgi:hypothetical protein